MPRPQVPQTSQTTWLMRLNAENSALAHIFPAPLSNSRDVGPWNPSTGAGLLHDEALQPHSAGCGTCAAVARQEGAVMDTWVGFVVILAVWTVLQVWLLPRLGVPT